MVEGKKITIFGRKNSINVMKVLWCCEELELAFDRVDVGGEFEFRNVPNYLGLNPNGRVPTIRDGSTVLWESNVIVRYLSEKYGRGLLWPSSQELRWDAEKWMDWQQAHLGSGMGLMLRQLVRTPPERRDMAAVEEARVVSAAAWKIADGHFSRNSFTAGEEFSMGDIPIGCLTYRWFALEIERPSMPHLEAYYERLKSRHPFRTHVLIPLS